MTIKTCIQLSEYGAAVDTFFLSYGEYSSFPKLNRNALTMRQQNNNLIIAHFPFCPSLNLSAHTR